MSSCLFFIFHNPLLLSLGSVLSLTSDLDNLDVLSTVALTANWNWYQRTTEQNRCLPTLPMPLMIYMHDVTVFTIGERKSGLRWHPAFLDFALLDSLDKNIALL